MSDVSVVRPSLDSPLPLGWVPSTVKNCKDQNSVVFDAEINSIGKPSSQSAANTRPKILKCKRILRDQLVRCSNLLDELKSQPRFLSLVPFERAFNVKFDRGFRLKSILLHCLFCESRSITSKAGWAEERFSRYRSKRAWASSRWLSGTGISSGCSEI